METKIRRRKLDNYEKLCQRFSANVNYLINSTKGKKITNKQLSILTSASQDSVSKWLSGKRLPSTDQLYTIADFLNVSIDWLFDKNPTTGAELRYTTYYDAFITFRKFISCELLDAKAIKDPFLSFLIKDSINIDNSNIPSNKVSSWYKKVELDYNVPIFDSFFLNQYYTYASDSFNDINEYDSYLARLNGLIAWENFLNDPHTSFDGEDLPYVFSDWAHEYLDNLV